MAKLDLTKPYRTRNGCEAHVVEGPDGWLYGYHMGGANGGKSRTWWRPNGAFNPTDDQNEFDLVAVPETRTVKVWMNIYESNAGWFSGAWPSKKEADSNRGGGRIACIEREITYTVGEGLSPENTEPA